MKKLLVGGAVAALAVAFAPAIAQPAPPPPPGVAPGVAPVAPLAPAPHVRMMMSDRTMTRAEASQHVAKMFAKLDTNRDGFVTREEVEALHHKMMGAMDGRIERKLSGHGMFMGDRGAMFDRLDTNKDGNISRQEFMASHPQVRQERMFVMRERGEHGAPGEPGTRMRMHAMGGGMRFGGHLFDMADANKDGRVSLAEAQAAALAHFDKADLNRDGKITPDERQQMHRLRMERGQS
jgi:EF hand domain-containing protein